jgi:hypothetical protein
MSRRRSQNYRNALSPALMANCGMAAVILAGIGMTYAWLSWQKKERGDRNNATRSAIEQLRRQRQAQQVRMKARLDKTELRQLVESMALGLVDIPAGKVEWAEGSDNPHPISAP